MAARLATLLAGRPMVGRPPRHSGVATTVTTLSATNLAVGDRLSVTAALDTGTTQGALALNRLVATLGTHGELRFVTGDRTQEARRK